MNEFRDTLILATMALVLSTAWLLAWIAGIWIDTGSSLVRGGLSLLWVVLVGGAVWVAIRKATHDVQTAYRYLDRLTRMSHQDLLAEAQSEQASPLSKSSPWFDVAVRMKATMVQGEQRFEEAEHQRTALEIRARRNESRCERIESILATLNEPVLVVDGYDELVLANASAERLFNFKAGSIEKRALSQLLRCEKLVELLHETRRRKSLSTRTDEVELAGPDGQRRWYSITANSLPAETAMAAGEPSAPHGALAVLRDISNQKAIQQRNAEFVSAVSHEMKTPLAGIKAYVEMLVDGDAEDEDTQEEFLNVINSQADRMRRLIDNLLNLARIESGVVKVHKSTCSLNELLEEACGIVRPSAEARQIELIADLSPMYLSVLVDRDQLLQAAINLLSNAIKYTHEGGSVTLHSRLADKRAEFDVEDTGVGIGPEECSKVFEKFYRVQKDKQMAQGTGLGLPLAKYIVEDVHGGRLTVRSTLGVGSTFTVSLPGAGEMA